MGVIVRGEDKVITVTLKDDTGTPIDLTTVNGYIVVFFQVGKESSKYSKNVLAGYDTLTELDQVTDTGKFTVNLQSAATSQMIVNKPLFMEIKTQTAQAGFDNTTFDQIVTRVKVGDVVDSITKGETLI